MNYKELQAAMAERLGVSQKVAAAALEAFARATVEELTSDGLSTIASLGTLELKEKEQRVMFNPNTGKKMLIPPKIVVAFRQSPQLKTRLN